MIDNYDAQNKPIKKATELRNVISKIEDEITEKQMILSSLNASLVRAIREIVNPFSLAGLKEAFAQQHEKKKSDRLAYEYMKRKIPEGFFHENKDVKLTFISQEGYEGYKYNFHFAYKGTNLMLGIPDVKKANEKNLYFMDYGKYTLYHEKKPGSNVWEFIASSYSEKEVEEAFDKFCEERGVPMTFDAEFEQDNLEENER